MFYPKQKYPSKQRITKNPMTTKTPNLRRLDAAAFARAAQSLSHTQTLAELPRVRDMLAADASSATVSWTARGQQRPTAGGGAPEVWLHLSAHTTAPLTCQRCLGAVDVAIELERAYRFVANEAEAAAHDADSDEDLLPLDAPLDLVALVEDEIIMAAPIAPRHEGACPQAPPMQFEDADFAAAQLEKPNPFAALSALKKH